MQNQPYHEIQDIEIYQISKLNKCLSHIAPFSWLYLAKLKAVVQLKAQQ